jgi:hypothetical protein
VPAQVTAVRGAQLVGANHHRHRIPANETADPFLVLRVARRRRLQLGRDGVDVSGRVGERNVGAGSPRDIQHLLEKEMSPLRPFALYDSFQRVEPLPGFNRVLVGGIVCSRQVLRYGSHRVSSSSKGSEGILGSTFSKGNKNFHLTVYVFIIREA